MRSQDELVSSWSPWMALSWRQKLRNNALPTCWRREENSKREQGNGRHATHSSLSSSSSSSSLWLSRKQNSSLILSLKCVCMFVWVRTLARCVWVCVCVVTTDKPSATQKKIIFGSTCLQVWKHNTSVIWANVVVLRWKKPALFTR